MSSESLIGIYLLLSAFSGIEQLIFSEHQPTLYWTKKAVCLNRGPIPFAFSNLRKQMEKNYIKINLCFLRQQVYVTLILSLPDGKIYGVATYSLNILTGFEIVLTTGSRIAGLSLISNSLPVNALLHRALIYCHKIYHSAVPFLLVFNIF